MLSCWGTVTLRPQLLSPLRKIASNYRKLLISASSVVFCSLASSNFYPSRL
jgi:hypothetical protein